MAHLTTACIDLNIQGNSPYSILKQLAEMAWQNGFVTDRTAFLQTLLLREKLHSTGFGNGVAVPHGKKSRGHTTVCVVRPSSLRRGLAGQRRRSSNLLDLPWRAAAGRRGAGEADWHPVPEDYSPRIYLTTQTGRSGADPHAAQPDAERIRSKQWERRYG